MRRTVRFPLCLTAVAALALGLGTTSSAQAHDTCYWKTVTVYVPVEQSQVHYVTRYDHCGQPYQAKVVTTETVQVPVTRRIKICG